MAAAVAESLGTTPQQSVCASGRSAAATASNGNGNGNGVACDAAAVGEKALASIEFAHALDDSESDDSDDSDN